MVLFMLVSVLLSPLTIVGVLWYYWSVTRATRRNKLSLTAYQVHIQRWLLHYFGERRDPAAARLMPALPGCHPLQLALIGGPAVLAARLSGHIPRRWRYPAIQPCDRRSLVVQRTGFIDDALMRRRSRVEQIVILGAGWDTRCYGQLRHFSGRLFEVDRPEMQRVKRISLRGAGLEAGRVTFVEVNFQRQCWLEQLKTNGFDPESPTFFLWEGVIYYLPPEEVDRTFGLISGIPGSLVAFDYPSERMVKRPDKLMRRALKLFEAIGEPWRCGLPTEPDPVACLADFVSSRGLELLDCRPFGQEGAYLGGVASAAAIS